MHRVVAALVGVVVASSFLSAEAIANERHFTYTYESATLPQGAREVEIWTTSRLGRNGYYSRFDQRLEFEVGVTDRLMTSLYLNGKTVAAPDSAGDIAISTEWGSVSNEWKYKLLDPAADAVGLALYGEVTAATDELELEAKLIVDKRIGNVLLAGNLVLENEWGFTVGEVGSELVAEVDLAASYFLTDRLTLGVELRHANIFAGGAFEHSALFFGPTVAYARDDWWVALTIMPQLPNFVQPSGTALDVGDFEKFNARLLFSFHL